MMHLNDLYMYHTFDAMWTYKHNIEKHKFLNNDIYTF